MRAHGAGAGRAGRRPPAARRRLIGLVAGPLLLVGCASAPAATSTSATSTAASSAAGASAAAAQYASDTPPDAARMICSDELRRQVAGALNVSSVPTPQAAWADHVYTCTYALPRGSLVLSVTVTPSTAAAGAELATLRGRLGSAEPEPGVGEQAYGTPTGTVVAVKDNMVLRVDATGLPDDLGVTHERRIDLARILAAAVLSCWTGEG